MADRLFPALLKYWRNRRGYSQLDLALAADVSARHISFLESGRSLPSEEMVLQLMQALSVPLRDQNESLRAAGYLSRYPEPALHALDPAVENAIVRMLAQHEPFPMTVLNGAYEVVRTNQTAAMLFARCSNTPPCADQRINMIDFVFDPRYGRASIKNWRDVAHYMVSRLHREALAQASSGPLTALLNRALSHPDVPREWRLPDFSVPSAPSLFISIERDALRMQFLTTITMFSAPQSVTLEELRIESYFPLNDATQSQCEEFFTMSSLHTCGAK